MTAPLDEHPRPIALWRRPPRRVLAVLAGIAAAMMVGSLVVGRDVLEPVARAGLFTMAVTALALAASTVVGLGAGAFSGWLGRRWEDGVERVAQAFDAFPAIVMLALLEATHAATGWVAVAIASSVVHAARLARSSRSALAQLAAGDVVFAARALGASRLRILRRHVLPRLTGTLARSCAGVFATVVSLETAAALLPFPMHAAATPSWGALLAEGVLRLDEPLLLATTALSVAAVALGSSALLDALASRARAR